MVIDPERNLSDPNRDGVEMCKILFDLSIGEGYCNTTSLRSDAMDSFMFMVQPREK